MVMSCSALGCRNRFTKKSKQVNGQLTFHKFPSDNPMFPEKVALRQLWHAACKRPNWVAPKRAVLCSEHFLPSDFYHFNSVVKLRENVVPSIFKNTPSNTQLQKRSKPVRKSTSKVRVTTFESQQVETGTSLDLSGTTAQSLGLALRNTNFLTSSVCTLRAEFVDDNVIRTLSLNNAEGQNFQGYFNMPTCSSFTDPARALANELQCLNSLNSNKDTEEMVVVDPVEELRKCKLKLEEAKKKIKTLSEKVRRQEARLTSYDHHVNELKYEAQDAAEILSKNLPVGTKQLLKRLALKSDVTSHEESAYHDDLKSYATTLHGISPRAYDFVRQSFNKALPSTSRIRQWKHDMSVTETVVEPPVVQQQAILVPGLYVMEQRSAVENLLEEL